MSVPPRWSDAAVLARTTARVLSLGGSLAGFAMVLTIGSLVALAESAAARIGWLAPIALGAAGFYYSLRARFDQRLFDDLAQALANGVDESEALRALDASLAALGWARAETRQRSLAERARGATQLLRRAAVLIVLQFAVAGALWLRDAPR
jgi:hypothetical protein